MRSSSVSGKNSTEKNDRIYAECDPRNTGSWKLLEKAGMKQEAFFHKNIYFHKDENGNPIWKDTYVYAILGE